MNRAQTYISILRQVRAQLKSDRVGYICTNVRKVHTADIYYREGLRLWIMELLGGVGSLEDWLVREGYSKHLVWDSATKVNETRLAWIDWMIAYWQGRA